MTRRKYFAKVTVGSIVEALVVSNPLLHLFIPPGIKVFWSALTKALVEGR